MVHPVPKFKIVCAIALGFYNNIVNSILLGCVKTGNFCAAISSWNCIQTGRGVLDVSDYEQPY